MQAKVIIRIFAQCLIPPPWTHMCRSSLAAAIFEIFYNFEVAIFVHPSV